ncbi:41865_t:CDS:2, partial [Gigaspora margarita]
MEIETNPISEDTGRHTRPIVTNNKDRNAKEEIKLEESYTLWDLPLNFNNTQIKLLMKRYGKKNTLYEKKITHSHNKENVSGKTTKYKNHYNEDKRKEGYNVERSRYIESLDEKLQIILQRLDKIEANRSRDGNKSTWKKMGPPIASNSCKESKDKRKVRAEDQKENKKNRKEARMKQLKRVTKGDNSKGRRQNCEFIFMGDFNTMVDDKGTTEKPKGKNKGKTLPIVNWFGRQSCYDTYRTLNPQKLYKRITRVGTVKKWLIDKNLMVEDEKEVALDSIWEALEKGILETAMKHIPKKKICKTRVTRDSKKRPRLDKLIIELDRWEKVSDRDRKHRQKIGRQEHRGLERICIERRCQMIDGEQERMLASLLEKPFNHIVVDKLLENQNNTRVLTCDPEKVKEKTKEFFQKQFRRRCFDSDALGEKWAQVYAPLERVQKKWFEALDKNISEKEWEGIRILWNEIADHLARQ